MTAALKLNPTEELVSHVKRAVHETFYQIHGVHPVFSEAIFSNELHVVGEVSGLIDLVQEKVDGSLILCFHKPGILAIAERVYRKKMTELDKSAIACVSELCNITYGVFKKHMNLLGYKFKMSLPHVIQGKSHKLWNDQLGTVVEIPVKMGDINFVVILALSKKEP